MLTTDTIFIASKLDNLISGDITSQDIVKAKALPDKIEGLAKQIVTGNVPKSSTKGYNFKKISESLNFEESLEELVDKGAQLVKNTDVDFADLIPKIDQVKTLLKGLLPFIEQSDVLGLRLSEPSKRDQLGFIRLFAAIDNPVMVLARIGDNSFTSAEMNIVKEVYPELVEGVQGMILTYITDLAAKGKDVVGHTRSLGIKRFFGEDVTGLSPEMAKAEEQQAPQQKQSKSRPSKSGAANRMMPEGDRDLL